MLLYIHHCYFIVGFIPFISLMSLMIYCLCTFLSPPPTPFVRLSVLSPSSLYFRKRRIKRSTRRIAAKCKGLAQQPYAKAAQHHFDLYIYIYIRFPNREEKKKCEYNININNLNNLNSAKVLHSRRTQDEA